MTTSLHDLRQNLADTREQYGRRSSRTAEAFQALVRAAAEAGTPLDGLRHHTENEVERFFSWTIAGVDGHVYWDGPKAFARNDGKHRTPLRWWWQYKYGNLVNSDDLVVKCGEQNCINPEHAAKERVRGSHITWTEQQIIGALQVEAMRLGHSPTTNDWAASGRFPVRQSIESRFGSWGRALEAAGLPPAYNRYARISRSQVIAGIRYARQLLGHWPGWGEYASLGKQLHQAGHPSTIAAAMRIYGSWPAARQAAGGPADTRSEGQRRRHRASREARAREDEQPTKGTVN